MQHRRRGYIFITLLGAVFAVLFWAYRPVTIPPDTAIHGEIDRILVEKSQRKMTVFRDGVALKTYDIDLGFAPIGAKATEGDGRTPEGSFRIDRRNANSKFHLSLGLDYPQPQHRRAAKAAGVSAGGDIMIHGQPNLLPANMKMPADWTAGCIAVSNAQIEEIFAATPIGTVVEILP